MNTGLIWKMYICKPEDANNHTQTTAADTPLPLPAPFPPPPSMYTLPPLPHSCSYACTLQMYCKQYNIPFGCLRSILMCVGVTRTLVTSGGLWWLESEGNREGLAFECVLLCCKLRKTSIGVYTFCGLRKRYVKM